MIYTIYLFLKDTRVSSFTPVCGPFPCVKALETERRKKNEIIKPNQPTFPWKLDLGSAMFCTNEGGKTSGGANRVHETFFC